MTEPMTAGMTQAEIDEIRAAEQAATPGPWEICLGSGINVCTGIHHWAKDNKAVFIADCLPDYAIGLQVESEYDHRPNMRFIALSRTAVPKLLAEVERLKVERDTAIQDMVNAVGGQRCAICVNDQCHYNDDEEIVACSAGMFQWRGPKHLADAIIPVGIRTLPEVGK